MADQGFLIYPGKLTVADSFRMGCIGRLNADQMRAAVGAVETAMRKLGVTCGKP
jgi:2-aminoethylphosphonate-pyruvate transaminase